MSSSTETTSIILRELIDDGALSLPDPAGGATSSRHAALCEVTRRNPVAVGRLAEAHTDGVSIVHEAGLDTDPGLLYGVWASETPGAALRLETGGRTVSGAKTFCSGLGIVDRALVTAVDADGRPVLLDVRVDDAATLTTDTTGWSSPALAGSSTGTITFDGHPIERIVSPRPDWYLQRPGFWHGACGPAACWAGGALSLVDHAEQITDEDPHRRAHLGAMRALAWELDAILDQAGRQIDAEPSNAAGARRRALSVRHLVERAASEILDRFGRAFGPRPFVGDPAVAQRFADVHLYLRQDHAERDLAALAEPLKAVIS